LEPSSTTRSGPVTLLRFRVRKEPQPSPLSHLGGRSTL
jgi:hypothetical protein